MAALRRAARRRRLHLERLARDRAEPRLDRRRRDASRRLPDRDREAAFLEGERTFLPLFTPGPKTALAGFETGKTWAAISYADDLLTRTRFWQPPAIDEEIAALDGLGIDPVAHNVPRIANRCRQRNVGLVHRRHDRRHAVPDDSPLPRAADARAQRCARRRPRRAAQDPATAGIVRRGGHDRDPRERDRA